MSAINLPRTILSKPSFSSLASDPYFIGPVDEVDTENLTVGTINGQSYPPPPGTGFVTLTGTETLSNKSLIDSSTTIIDAVDATKRIMFDAAGSTNTLVTLRTTGTAASRIYTLPEMGSNTDFLFAAGAQTITGNKNFSAGTLRVSNSVDATVYMTFTAGTAPAGAVASVVTSGLLGSRTYQLIDPGVGTTEILLGTATQTVTGTKTFGETARMARASDSTVYIRFVPGASPSGTVTTIATAMQAASRTYTIPDAGTDSSFVMANGTQTLSGKSFTDSTFSIVDLVDQSISIAFDAAGTTGTRTTITSSQTADSNFVLPNSTINDTFVLADATQNLTNKGFASDTTYFYNPAVPTKRISFDPSGLNANVTYTIRAAAGTANRVFSLPNTANDTFTLNAATQTLTNKTLTSTTNNIVANQLRTTTGTVGIGGSPAPNVGDVLVAISSVAATWQAPAAAPTTFSDATFAIYDSVDTTKQILFDAAGTTLTTATIRSAQTASRIYTIPDASADDSFVLLTPAQTLTNKTLTFPVISTISNGGTITIPTGTDTLVGRATTDTLTNKTLTLPVIASISNGGTITIPTGTDTLVARNTTDTLTNKTLTLPVIASISNGGTITIPTGTDTLVGRDTTDTLTNKTITSTTNTVAAKQLVTATGVVSIGASAAPSANQVLVATNATTAAWAAPSVTTVTGTLPVANGGTGVTTLTAGNVLVGAGTSDVTTTKAAPTGDFVGTTDTQSLTNKSLADNTTRVYAASNNTIFVNFDAGGTASTGTTFVVRQSANRNINFLTGAVNCNALLSEGAQTINGVNTFTASILVPTITETVANAGTTINSVNVRTVVSAGVNVGVVEATAANSYLALLTTGTGAITAQIPNSAVSGGNVRGTNAVDLQTARSSATHIAGGTNSGILCGNSNRVAAAGNAVIGGGNTNLVGGGATNSGIFSGLTNTINSNILQGVICGGARNTSGANFSGVLAGDSNSSNGARSAVGGGNANTAGGSNSFVGGGDGNTANSTNGFAGAGSGNLVSGARASIPGGLNNTASGADSTVLYGASCTATASYTVSGGNGAQSTAAGALTIVDSQATTTTNGNIDRAVMRFNNGYRFITGPTAPIRFNNAHYKYTTLYLASAGGAVGDNNFLNGDIALPTQFSARYVVRAMGVQAPNTTGAFNPAPNTASYHIAYDEGVISGDQVVSNTARQITSITNTRSTNSTVANIQNSVLNNTLSTFPFTFTVRMNIPGAFGLTMVWRACVDLYINDTNSPDPV